MALPEQHLRTGTVLAGKYRIDGLLGKGGMGTVYAAWHVVLGTKVAVKVRRESAKDQSSISRVLNEARALAALENEHVARVTDAGLLGSGEPYIVMEYLDGEDLAAILARRTRLPAMEAVLYIFQALEGLAEAHGRGIVHRDIKPSNLFVARNRRGRESVKLLDFGISKRDETASFGAHRRAPHDGVLSTMGSGMLGTPAYMAPEQIHSPKLVDNRADIWAIGVVLYELVAGERPFLGDPLAELLSLTLERLPPALGDVVPGCSPALSEAVARCLRVSPEGRFQTVAELAESMVGEVAGGMERVERIRAALERSLTSRVSFENEDADARSAPTRTLELSVRPAGRPVVEETRAAWGPAPSAEQSARTRRPRSWVLALGSVALAAFAVFLIVARTRPTPAPQMSPPLALSLAPLSASSSTITATSMKLEPPRDVVGIAPSTSGLASLPRSEPLAPPRRRRPAQAQDAVVDQSTIGAVDAAAPSSKDQERELDLFNRR